MRLARKLLVTMEPDVSVEFMTKQSPMYLEEKLKKWEKETMGFAVFMILLLIGGLLVAGVITAMALWLGTPGRIVLGSMLGVFLLWQGSVWILRRELRIMAATAVMLRK
jgi:hypothetical protein